MVPETWDGLQGPKIVAKQGGTMEGPPVLGWSLEPGMVPEHPPGREAPSVVPDPRTISKIPGWSPSREASQMVPETWDGPQGPKMVVKQGGTMDGPKPRDGL